MGISLALFFLVVSITGLLLGWKKHSNGIIHPKSYEGISTNMADWMPMAELHKIAVNTLHQKVDPEVSSKLDRVDARPDKGMVKFVFEEDYHGIQLDATTGAVLHLEKRRSDFIENIHDGSILDYWFNTDGEIFKLIYSSIIGVSLFLFVVTGMWLWLGPKVMRRRS
jgi:uncharacterized iron-regulated membrane protein